MKKTILAILICLALLGGSAYAVTLLQVPQGGTGVGSVTSGSYLKGAGTAALVERTVGEVKTDLSLNNVENTAISTWAGSGNITTVGTLGSLEVTGGKITATETSAGALHTQVRHVNLSNTVGTGARLSFRMQDSVPNTQTYGRISTEVDVNTNDSEDGTMRLTVWENGAATDYLILNGNTGTVDTSKMINANGGVTGALTGNASTASALAADPTDCGGNTWATTIAADGDLTCSAIGYAGISAMTSANFAGIISDESGSDKVAFTTNPVFTTPNIGAATGSVSGNAGTATALASDPTDCAANNYAYAINTSGNLTCSTIDISASTNLAAGRSLTLSDDSVAADPETYVYKSKIAFEDPTATDDFFFGEIATAVTFTSIYCKTLVGTVNLDVTIAGTDINGVDIVCDTTGVLDSSLGGDTAGAAGEELKLEITSVASTPTYLFLQINGTYND